MIAAAGKSTRLGRHKALAPLGQDFLIHYSARTLASIYPDKFYVTLPNELMVEHDLLQGLFDLNVKCMPSHYPTFGYIGSVRTVLEQEALHNFDGIMIAPVDSPLLSKELLLKMINCAHMYGERPTIIVPHFYLSPGHPVYFSKDFFYTLKTLQKNTLRTVIKNNAPCAHSLFFPDVRILLNLNSKADWNRLTRICRLQNRSPR
jgi:CTP:molybdopterin cytidylyltransferase MocA